MDTRPGSPPQTSSQDAVGQQVVDIQRHLGRLCPCVEDHGQPVIVQPPGEGVDVVVRVERLELPAAQSRVGVTQGDGTLAEIVQVAIPLPLVPGERAAAVRIVSAIQADLGAVVDVRRTGMVIWNSVARRSADLSPPAWCRKRAVSWLSSMFIWTRVIGHA